MTDIAQLGRPEGGRRRDRFLLAALSSLFVLAAVAAPVNHDESQYVGAIAMMRHGLPFRDWPFLQTPLQPLLLSPLSLLPAGWLLVGARLANVVFALVTCWALLRLLRDRVPWWAAATATVGMATTNAFLFGTEVARNDMLPAALLALSLVAFIPADRVPDWRRTALGGLCLGLAISAKISMAVPAAGAGIWLLWRWRMVGGRAVLAALGGGLVGLLPTLVLCLMAPGKAFFGVIAYSLLAPQLYWTAIGQGYRLEPIAKLAGLATEAVKGPIAVALLLTLATLRHRARQRLLEIMALGGLIAAYLPDPFFKQYIIPLLPPLFARAAIALPTLTARWRRIALTAGGLSAVAGIIGTLVAIGRMAAHKAPMVEVVERGRAVARAANGGLVVSLSPEQVAGADMLIAPGIVTGPFLFRIQGENGAYAQGLTGAPTFERLAPLHRQPPAVIVTGGERRSLPPLYPQGLDGFLDRWARERGYRPSPLPGEGWILWSAPTQKGGPEGPPFRVTQP